MDKRCAIIYVGASNGLETLNFLKNLVSSLRIDHIILSIQPKLRIETYKDDYEFAITVGPIQALFQAVNNNSKTLSNAKITADQLVQAFNHCIDAKILNECDKANPAVKIYNTYFIAEEFNVAKSFDNIVADVLKRRRRFKIKKYLTLKHASDAHIKMILTKAREYRLQTHELRVEVNDNIVCVEADSFEYALLFEDYIRRNVSIKCDKIDYGIDLTKWHFFQCVKEANKIIAECYEKFTSEEVFLCFNGGKDCTVLLHLTLKYLSEIKLINEPIFCMYIQSQSPFPEVEHFINQCAKYYNLNLKKITGNIKDGLDSILKENKQFRACLMGTRRTDPYSQHLSYFQMTDKDWPQVMRVSPILDWNYTQIWDYLLAQRVPYCSLYDLGFTSLGSRTNTLPNPALKTSSGNCDYRPAYELLDGSRERDGRVIVSKQ